MIEKPKEISVAEFFEKNKHILGYSNPAKALVTCVKEAVDNSLDATEEAGILPDILVRINRVDKHYRITVEDNGPGIEKIEIINDLADGADMSIINAFIADNESLRL